jgi:hypothetical protein
MLEVLGINALGIILNLLKPAVLITPSSGANGLKALNANLR